MLVAKLVALQRGLSGLRVSGLGIRVQRLGFRDMRHVASTAPSKWRTFVEGFGVLISLLPKFLVQPFCFAKLRGRMRFGFANGLQIAQTQKQPKTLNP